MKLFVAAPQNLGFLLHLQVFVFLCMIQYYFTVFIRLNHHRRFRLLLYMSCVNVPSALMFAMELLLS